MLTRAQSLLVIIGDPHTLYTDPNWSYLLEFCKENESFDDSEGIANGNPFQFPNPIVLDCLRELQD